MVMLHGAVCTPENHEAAGVPGVQGRFGDVILGQMKTIVLCLQVIWCEVVVHSGSLGYNVRNTRIFQNFTW